MEQLKVLVITYYFPPSGGSGVQRWMYFSKYLPNDNIEPFVITVDPAHASYKFIDHAFEKKVADVKVFRTKTREILSLYSYFRGGDKKENIPQGFSGESNPGFFQKVSRFMRGNFFLPDARKGWNRYAFKKATEIIEKEKIGIVITTGPPHSTHLIGLKLKKKFGIKWLADFRDPWTEVYYNNMLYRTSLAKNIDAATEKKVLSSADMVLTIGPGMQKLLQKKIPTEQQSKVKFIYNGFDGELFRGLIKIPANYFCIHHSGILSESQPIDAFLTGLKMFFEKHPESIGKTRMQFVGKVSPSILSAVEMTIGKERMITTGYVSHGEAVQHMKNADLLLNSFAITDDSSLLVSGKLMEYMATGNPILGLGHPQGDAAELLRNNPFAKIFERTNVQGIFLFIEKIYLHWLNKESSNSADETSLKYSREETAHQLADLLKNQL